MKIKGGFLEHYGQTVLLLLGVLTGALCGSIFGPAASVARPLGELFLNLMFVIIIPLVFFSIASSICRLTSENKVGKTIGWSLVVFISLLVIATTVAWFTCQALNPLGKLTLSAPPGLLGDNGAAVKGASAGEIFVSFFTVDDFSKLFSKSHLLPLIVFATIVGVATSLRKEKGKPFADVLASGMDVSIQFVNILMYAAPVCLGCYFADLVGNVGGQILEGYLNALLTYLAVTVIIYFGFSTLYAFLAGGRKTARSYWKSVLEPSLVAVSTCSSAACIPSSIESARKMGVRNEIAESVIPFGVNLHKDGSAVCSVINVVFTITYLGLSGYSGVEVMAIAITASLVVGAIPTGGMTSGILICSILGISPEYAAQLVVINTIVDIPATLLNVTGNISSALLVDRLCGD